MEGGGFDDGLFLRRKYTLASYLIVHNNPSEIYNCFQIDFQPKLISTQ